MKRIEQRPIPAWSVWNLLTASAIVLIVTQVVPGSSFLNFPNEVAAFVCGLRAEQPCYGQETTIETKTDGIAGKLCLKFTRQVGIRVLADQILA